jgi:HAD superfamily hydrolase (TIGR01509 family)
VGGVLVELGGLEVFRAWRGSHIDDAAVWRLWLHSPAVRAFERGEIEPEAFAALVIAEMDLPVSEAEFLETFMGWPRGPLPGVAELIDRLRPGIRRATLSNTNSLHWPRVIGEMGLGALFEHHFPSHETGRIKPDAEAFQHVAEALGLAPERILFLDDVTHNVEAAAAVGLRARQAVGVGAAERILVEHGLLD